MVAVHDVVAATVPDRDMVVCGDIRRTFGEVAQRTKSIAAFLGARGLGMRRQSSELERWESGHDPIALVLHNGVEYIEAMLGAYRARAVPFNVNQHYRPAEVGSLFADVGVRAVIYHRRYKELVETAATDPDIVLIEVDDGSGVDPLPGSWNFQEVARTPIEAPLPVPSPDDLYLVCTGGTTGRPKAVSWRQADIYVSAMAGTDDTTEQSIIDAATSGAGAGGPWYPVPPLMHAAAQWTAYSALHQGATVVLHDDSGAFDAREVLELVERERVSLVSIVGDAYAKPMVEELRRHHYDLSSLRTIGTGGAATSEQHMQALIDHLPDLVIRDGYGASETGGMAYGARTKNGHRQGFAPSPGATVVSADRSRYPRAGRGGGRLDGSPGPGPVGLPR